MKKVFLFLVFAMIVSVANAWHKNSEAGVVVLATKYLTPEAKALVEKHLGTRYEDDVDCLYYWQMKKRADYTNEIHYLHLDKDFQPLSVEGDDAYAALEKALTVVRAHKLQSDAEVKTALRYVINLMLDIHNLSQIRIENIPHSQADFKFKRQKSEYKPNEYKLYKWSTFFTVQSNAYAVFHADLWAEDMDLCHGKHREEYSKGELRDWVSANGALAAEILSEISPDCVTTLRRILELDFLNYDMMARAGYRLAVLLNDALK